MKVSVEYDLTTETVILSTDLSHRAYAVKRQLTCRECGTVNKNSLVEALRACAIYALSEKHGKDVTRAVFAYDLEEILRMWGSEVKHIREGVRRMPVADGTVLVRKLRPKTGALKIEDLGELT